MEMILALLLLFFGPAAWRYLTTETNAQNHYTNDELYQTDEEENGDNHPHFCISCQTSFDESQGYYEDDDLHCPNCDSDDVTYHQ